MQPITQVLLGSQTAQADVTTFLGVVGGLVSQIPPREGFRSGLFLVLDEINGIASEPLFAHFLKGVIDRNALAEKPIPFCLVLCGTPERRREIIATQKLSDLFFNIFSVVVCLL